MPQHKKTPVFIRVTASNKQVICINPLQLASFNIVEKAPYKVKSKTDPAVVETKEADTIHLYFPSALGNTYRVGVDITQADFDYICATLLEFLYLNESEFKAKSTAIETAKMDEWNKISEENRIKIDLSKAEPAPKEV